LKNTELAAVLIIIVVAAGVTGVSVRYFESNHQIGTNSLPSLPSAPQPTFAAGIVSADDFPSCVTYNPNGFGCAQLINFTLSMTITNGAQDSLNQVTGYVDGTQVGSCTLNILPNHYLPCSMPGNVLCSELSGGLPYAVRLVGSFEDGQTSVVNTTATPSYSAC